MLSNLYGALTAVKMQPTVTEPPQSPVANPTVAMMPPQSPCPGGTMRIRATAVLIALTCALTACSSNSSSDKPADPKKLDDAASLACDDFATDYKGAQTQNARIDLANKVNKWAQQSVTKGIAANATVLARGSEASAGAWQIGADAFAQSCLNAGWKG